MTSIGTSGSYLAENIKGSRNTVIEGATHYVQLERYREVSGVIEGFLSDLRYLT